MNCVAAIALLVWSPYESMTYATTATYEVSDPVYGLERTTRDSKKILTGHTTQLHPEHQDNDAHINREPM